MEIQLIYIEIQAATALTAVLKLTFSSIFMIDNA